MTEKKVECTIIKGVTPNTRIARVRAADGAYDEVVVSAKNLKGKRLLAWEIGRRDDAVLVELPRESVSGRWRMWVKASSVGG